MVETERKVRINGHEWVRVPANATACGAIYDEGQVRSACGDINVLRGNVVTSYEASKGNPDEN